MSKKKARQEAKLQKRLEYWRKAVQDALELDFDHYRVVNPAEARKLFEMKIRLDRGELPEFV